MGPVEGPAGHRARHLDGGPELQAEHAGRRGGMHRTTSVASLLAHCVDIPIGNISAASCLQARAAIKAGKLSEVAEWDELVNMMRQKRAFQGWQEGQLAFPPTFKFRRGTNIYLGK